MFIPNNSTLSNSTLSNSNFSNSTSSNSTHSSNLLIPLAAGAIGFIIASGAGSTNQGTKDTESTSSTPDGGALFIVILFCIVVGGIIIFVLAALISLCVSFCTEDKNSKKRLAYVTSYSPPQSSMMQRSTMNYQNFKPPSS